MPGRRAPASRSEHHRSERSGSVPRASRGSGSVILVAEDSPTQAEWIGGTLIDAGHEVAVVGDGEEALVRCRAGDIQLILSDVEMPKLDGFELCRRLKDDPDLRHIPVVLLTQRDRVTDVIRALEVGADNYLTKPFPAEELLSRVERLVSEIEAWRQRSRGARHRIGAHTEDLVLMFERTQVVEMLMGAAEKLESELSTVGEIVLGLTMDHDLHELLVVIAERTHQLAEAAMAGVALEDATGRTSLRAVSGGSPALRAALAAAGPSHWGLPPSGHRSRHPTIVRGADGTVALDAARSVDRSIGSALIVPLVVGDRTLGLLEILFGGDRLLPSDELRRYRTLGDQAAVAIENAQLFERERRALAELRAVLDATSDGMVVIDAERRIMDANPAAGALVGATLDRLMTEGLQVLPDSTRAVIEAVINDALTMATATGELTFQRSDEEQITVEYRATANVLPGRHLLVLHDVTERRVMEQRLFQAERLESIGRVTGGVAHDFNNLLNAISGFAALVDEGLPQGDPLHRDVAQITRAADRATELTSQLLAFSRRQHLEPAIVEPGSFLDELAPMLRRLIGPEVDLAIGLRRDTGAVRVDPGGLEQVIVNLAINARDAMPVGGRLAIDVDAVELDETYARERPSVAPGQYVVISVADSGTGMDESTVKRIFEPFFTTKPVGKGTGLGLASAHGFVNQSAGYIDVYSEPGMGTTFRIHLPRVAASPTAAPSARTVTEPIRGHETILVVEDDAAGRELVKRALESHGYRVLAAADAREALAIRDAGEPIDALVSDLVMPGMGGRDLAAAIEGDRSGLPVLFMSGYSEDFAAGRGVLGPGAAFIQKPFALTDLVHRLRTLLDEAG
jgi:PAS domain S-box-containing protein